MKTKNLFICVFILTLSICTLSSVSQEGTMQKRDDNQTMQVETRHQDIDFDLELWWETYSKRDRGFRSLNTVFTKPSDPDWNEKTFRIVYRHGQNYDQNQGHRFNFRLVSPSGDIATENKYYKPGNIPQTVTVVFDEIDCSNQDKIWADVSVDLYNGDTWSFNVWGGESYNDVKIEQMQDNLSVENRPYYSILTQYYYQVQKWILYANNSIEFKPGFTVDGNKMELATSFDLKKDSKNLKNNNKNNNDFISNNTVKQASNVKGNTFDVFPNPSSARFTITNNSNTSDFKIYSSYGNLVKEFKISGSESRTVKLNHRGVYNIIQIVDNQKLKSKKIIIE